MLEGSDYDFINIRISDELNSEHMKVPSPKVKDPYNKPFEEENQLRIQINDQHDCLFVLVPLFVDCSFIVPFFFHQILNCFFSRDHMI